MIYRIPKVMYYYFVGGDSANWESLQDDSHARISLNRGSQPDQTVSAGTTKARSFVVTIIINTIARPPHCYIRGKRSDPLPITDV